MVLLCISLSWWLGSRGQRVAALVLSIMPLAYFGLMIVVAKKLIAAIIAAVKGKVAQELIGAVPFEYMVPGPVPILPGKIIKQVSKGFFG